MGPPVVRCSHLHVLDRTSAITVVILDANVRELEVPVDERELVLARPLLDLFRATIGLTSALTATAVGLLQEALVLAFELFLEHDTPNPPATGVQPLNRPEIRAVQTHVVGQFARFQDAGIESLSGLAIPVTPGMFQQRPTLIGERDKPGARPFDDVWHRSHKAEIMQAFQLAHATALHRVVSVPERDLWNDTEGANRGEGARLRALELVASAGAAHLFAGRPAGEIEIAREHVAGIV
jgi:hypothetical protein